VSPDLGSSNHQPLPPEGEKMTKNEIATESGVHFKQAKHTIRKALQMPKLATQQGESKCTTDSLRAPLNKLRHPMHTYAYPEKHLAPKALPVTPPILAEH
jgi:hypothetical protein